MNTKKALAESLKRAMRHKPFGKITVSELIEDCGINRKTFYYHFEDIYALLKWMLEEESIEIVKGFDLLVDYEEAIEFVMDYIEENEQILNSAYDSLGREGLKRFFHDDFIEISRSLIEEAESISSRMLEDGYRDFLAEFFANAVTGIMIDWLRDRRRRDRASVTRYLSDTVKGSLKGIFSEYYTDV